MSQALSLGGHQTAQVECESYTHRQECVELAKQIAPDPSQKIAGLSPSSPEVLSMFGVGLNGAQCQKQEHAANHSQPWPDI